MNIGSLVYTHYYTRRCFQHKNGYFHRCSNHVELVIPECVTKIEDHVFYETAAENTTKDVIERKISAPDENNLNTVNQSGVHEENVA